MQKFFQFADGGRGGEIVFVEIGLIAILDGAHQLDALEGIEVQIFHQARARAKRFGLASGDLRDQFSERTWSDRGARCRCGLRAHAFEDEVDARLLRRRARKVFFGPHEPVADALVLAQRLVGPLDDLRGRGGLRIQQQDGAGFGVFVAL